MIMNDIVVELCTENMDLLPLFLETFCDNCDTVVSRETLTAERGRK